MQTIKDPVTIIQQQGVLPLFYDNDTKASVEVIRALYKVGIRAVEYTNRGTYAIENFIAMKEVCRTEMPDMLLGIGTIKSESDAEQFATAGAAFIISPGVSVAIAEVATKAGIPWMPGCITPTEIMLAEAHGAKLVKLFPGSLLGPSYVTAVKDVFPQLLFMPTGGVELTEESFNGWFSAGVCAVGLGSKVISKHLLLQKNYTAIGHLTKEALDIAARLRSQD